MRRRVGRPGLIGTMARTAVISGTATAVSGGVARRQQARAQGRADQQRAEEYAAQEKDVEMASMQAQLNELRAQQTQQAPPPPPAAPQAPAAPAAPGGGDDLLAKIQQLADLKAAGVLSDEEFAAAKAKLLS